VPVLKGISFHAEAGSTTALVGSSGSGKSTILSLVLNFIQPGVSSPHGSKGSDTNEALTNVRATDTAGVIRIDGKDLQSAKRRDYRRHLGVVLQDNFLFDGTILE